jgi:hypothetical protein
MTAGSALKLSATLAALLSVAVAGLPALADTSPEEARGAALRFGNALLDANASALRPILPTSGKVRVDLRRLGPADGLFGTGQVEAVFKDFLSAATVKSFELIRLECDGKSSALARGRAVLTDRDGRPGRVAIHLAFQPEDGRWVLREVKELAE